MSRISANLPQNDFGILAKHILQRIGAIQKAKYRSKRKRKGPKFHVPSTPFLFLNAIPDSRMEDQIMEY